MCWKECWRESVCGVWVWLCGWVWDGNSPAVGEEPGLSEWYDWREVLLLCDWSVGWYCGCRPVLVGEVTRMFGLSWVSRMSFGNGTLTGKKKGRVSVPNKLFLRRDDVAYCAVRKLW